MNVKIVYDSDTDRYYAVRPEEPYTDHLPVIDIPDLVLDGYFEAREAWDAKVEEFGEYMAEVVDRIGGDYDLYLNGDITEAQWRKRQQGCDHENIDDTGLLPHCTDCGRYRIERETWVR